MTGRVLFNAALSIWLLYLMVSWVSKGNALVAAVAAFGLAVSLVNTVNAWGDR